MVRFFSQLFNIRPAEWPRVLLLYSMVFLFVAGLIWGETIVEASFLLSDKVGLAFLPWVFIAKAIASIIAIAVYTAFADRVANKKLLIAILTIGAAAVAINRLLLVQNLQIIAYPLLYLLASVIQDTFVLHWWTYVNGFYDTRSAKRIVPVLASATRIASIVAGLSIPLLNRLFIPDNILFVWLSTLLGVALLAWLMPYLLKDNRTEQLDYTVGRADRKVDESPSSYLNNIREGFRYITRSSYLRWMAVGTLLIYVLIALLTYVASEILIGELESEQAFSNFIGQLVGIANLILLPIQLFVLSRIIGRIGLDNANLIFPAITLTTASGLIFLPLGIPIAALAYLNRTVFRTTFLNTIDGLLYNAVPLRIKGRARAVIGGLIVPVGFFIGGLLLLPANKWFLPTLIGLLALAYVGSALVVRKQYTQALIKLLQQEDYSFLLSQEASSLTVTDPTTLNALRQKLEESSSPEFTVFMAQLISQLGGKEAVPILGYVAKRTQDAQLRAAIIDTLIAAEIRNEVARQLYTDFLADPDSRVRQVAIAGLEQVAAPAAEQFVSSISNMLSDAEVQVRIRALSALVRTDNFYNLTPAVELLSQLLASQYPHQRSQGVRILGQIGDGRSVHTLLEYLADPEDEVRLAAAMTIEALAAGMIPQDSIPPLLETMTPLLQDPIERVRQATLTVFGHIGRHESYQAIVDALTDSSPQVRATAVEVLAQVGKSAVPIVHPQLEAPDPQLRKMAAVILSRINPREFGDLIKTYITGNLLVIYRNYGRIEALSSCRNYPSIGVLQSALREQNEELLNEIFYLLTAVYDRASIKVITDSLESDSARVRANAVEALEALTTPQTAQLIAPLFEPEPSFDQLLTLSKDTWDMQHPQPAEAIQQLVTDPDAPWLRAIMTFALGEMGATLPPAKQPSADIVEPETTPPPETDPSRAGQPQQRQRIDPLAALAGLGDDEPQPKRRSRRTPPADLFGALTDEAPSKPPQRIDRSAGPTPAQSAAGANELPVTLAEIKAMVTTSLTDPVAEVSAAARTANRMLTGSLLTEKNIVEDVVLSTIEKIIFLKEVPFFQSMTIKQLQVLANICEEEFFEEDQRIFDQGDPGGALYVIVSGRVGIEQERRRGAFARLATLGTHSYFGEMTLFDNGPRSAAAIALQDTLTLRLRREPVIALARQYPDLSLELIKVLSERLRQANNRIADLTRTHPRELQKLFDKLD